MELKGKKKNKRGKRLYTAVRESTADTEKKERKGGLAEKRRNVLRPDRRAAGTDARSRQDADDGGGH